MQHKTKLLAMEATRLFAKKDEKFEGSRRLLWQKIVVISVKMSDHSWTSIFLSLMALWPSKQDMLQVSLS
jgi:hypothetical protein